MFDGTTKNVEDVRVSDLLMGPDSFPREVLRLVRDKGKMYKITPVSGESFIVNEDHVMHLICNSKLTFVLK